MPGPDPEVAIDPAGRLMIDPHDPVLAALAPDIDLRRCRARVAPAGIIGVIADPGQLGQPDPRRPEHGEDAARRPGSPAGSERGGSPWSAWGCSPHCVGCETTPRRCWPVPGRPARAPIVGAAHEQGRDLRDAAYPTTGWGWGVNLYAPVPAAGHGADGVPTIWTETGDLIYQVEDTGRTSDPVTGRRRPPSHLWRTGPVEGAKRYPLTTAGRGFRATATTAAVMAWMVARVSRVREMAGSQERCAVW